ncbi:MAG: hypothetical protein PVH12_02905 [Candidatus Bathyarchaeota archaeon]
MKAKIAVATVSGKAYYLMVRELKRKKISFLSLTPNQSIPIQIKTVITTEEEEQFIQHEKILPFKDGMKPEVMISKALRMAQGKESYEKIIIGVDPGKVFGIAVLADGEIVETGNCFSIEETLHKIKSILENLTIEASPLISVKIGNGAPKYKNELMKGLDKILPSNVRLECVSEERTSSYSDKNKHRRGLRDIVSAVKIAGRNGNIFKRRKKK